MDFFGRNIEVKITALDKATKLFSTEDGFTIEFNCEFGNRSIVTAKIYNVLRSTATMCIAKGKDFPSLEISAGYQNKLSLLASGSIISFHATQNGADRILEMKMGAKLDTLLKTNVIQTFQKQKASAILNSIFKDSLISYYVLNLVDDPIIENISFTGNLQQALISICKILNATYYSKFGKIIVESKTFPKTEKDFIILDRTSGLIGSPEINGTSLKAKSLLNPDIATGEIIQINYVDNWLKKEVSGKYKIGNGKHYGGNKIESFFTEFECKKI